MSLSLILIAVAVPVMVAVMLLVWRRAGSAAWQERELLKLAQRRNLAVPPRLESELRRHLARRQRAWTVSFGLAYLVVFAPASLVLPESGSGLGPAVIVLAFAAGAFGTTLTALVDRRRAVFGDARVGRLDGPTVGDLLSTTAVRVVILAVAAAVTASALLWLLPRRGDAAVAAATWAPLVSALAVVGVVTLLLWRILASRIAANRPISGDANALAWSDALRAESISSLLMLPVFSTMLSLQFAIPTIATLVFPDWFEAFNIGLLVGVAVSLTLIVVVHTQTSGGSAARHYQRRLWPELAAGAPGAGSAPEAGRA